ncbi:heterokaryon incompatibility protein-domain-containing protein [Schizothecium vesticola]|uniref:Heterokaryon incompatibility protein-domain-containing protein n=1 Tax=Schizothecium vesticola TaxID=314040 RepID=A0AA40BPR1_9PEZI|nr:heterokaryon incompatibility protein-domain-containing protein [Schizothecium vesticola]
MFHAISARVGEGREEGYNVVSGGGVGIRADTAREASDGEELGRGEVVESKEERVIPVEPWSSLDCAKHVIGGSEIFRKSFEFRRNQFKMSSDTSIYTPLAASESRFEVRLLEIIDDQGEEANHPVKCRLHTVSLDGKPNFCALSYLWGDPGVTVDIQILLGPDHDSASNVTTMPVTANLAAALRHAKRQCATMWSDLGYEPGQFRLWADAICINQKDFVERASQVQRMGDLYRSAAVVLAWFGEDDSGETSLAFDTVTKVAIEAGRCADLGPEVFNTLEWMQRYPELRDEDGDGDNSAWTAVAVLINNPYWSRVWIFQEVVLAQRLLLATDRSVMDLAPMHLTMARLLILQGVINQGGMAKPGWVAPIVWTRFASDRYVRYINVMGVSYDKLRLPGAEADKVGFANLAQRWDLAFRCAIMYDATDPKDLIYGVLGLTNIDMKPDYSQDKTTHDVYCEFAETWLRVAQLPSVTASTPEFPRGLKALKYLGYAGIGLFSPSKGLPSWAPNFAARASSTLYFGLTGRDDDTRADEGLFASDNSIAFIKGPSLFVRGMVVGKVLQVSEAPGGATQTDGRMNSFFVDFKERHPVYITGTPPLQAIFRLVCQDASPDVSRLTVLKASAFLLTHCGRSSGGFGATLSALGFSQPFIGAAANPNVLGEFDIWFRDAFFPGLSLEELPESGVIRCLLEGLSGPMSKALAGDLLCILKGCGVPVMLRKNGDHYTHISTCFVVGLMEGRNHEYAWAKEAAREDFEIR